MNPIFAGLVLLIIILVMVVLRTAPRTPQADVDAALSDKALVVDVRSAQEFTGGHVSGAINIPVDQIAARLGELGDPEQSLILYCASGMRSNSALKILKKHGFTQAINGGSLQRMMAASQAAK